MPIAQANHDPFFELAPVFSDSYISDDEFEKVFGAPFMNVREIVARQTNSLAYVMHDMASHYVGRFAAMELLRSEADYSVESDLFAVTMAAIEQSAFRGVTEPEYELMVLPSPAMKTHCRKMRMEIEAEVRKELDDLVAVFPGGR